MFVLVGGLANRRIQSQTPRMDAQGQALVALGRELRSIGYRFIAVTPSTHRIVLDRPPTDTSLQSIFGWNRPFERADLPERIFALLVEAGALESWNDRYKSRVRLATIDDLIFVHSAFPTDTPDAVFFGPDTYRFVRLVRSSLGDLTENRPRRIVDIGCGSGAGGLCAARLLAQGGDVVLADINRKALSYAAVNAAINEVGHVETAHSDILDGIEGPIDVVLANPPYLVDEGERLYRHGGGKLGLSISLRIVEQGLARLDPGGRLIVYTGTPIIHGVDPFFDSVRPLLQLHARQFVYEEIDPDVFGEELRLPAYLQADRIAAVGLTVIKQG
jgi:methylase of polypeptide subunit release factors